MSIFLTSSVDLVEVVRVSSLAVATIGGLIAAIKAISEMRRAGAHREKELRWKQAKEGKELVSSTLEVGLVSSCLRMIDVPGAHHEISADSNQAIHWVDIQSALVPDVGWFDEKQLFIRDCFDSLFFHLGQIEHFIKSGLVTFEDVESPIRYYIGRLDEIEGSTDSPDLFKNYAMRFAYYGALAFIERVRSEVIAGSKC